MHIRIDRIPAGVTNVWLIRGSGAVLVDAGMAGAAPSTLRRLEALGVAPRSISVLVLTHGHGDHCGAAAALRAATGARLVVHTADRRWVQEGRSPFPPGVTAYGQMMAALMAASGWLTETTMRMQAVNPDIILDDDGLNLSSYGIAGRIVHTPGHTPGSVSVVLEGSEAFVGDLAMNGLPFCLKPSLPILAMDLPTVKASWRRLLQDGVRTVYPAHGSLFASQCLKEALS